MITKNSIIFAAAVLVCLFTPPALTVAAAGTAQIQITGEHTYKSVRLSPPVYNASNRNLSDILILDENKNPVPYFINNYETVKSGAEASKRSLVLADTFVKDGSSFVDFYAETQEGHDISATSISIHSKSGMFAKNIELYGGYDGMVWDYIKSDALYRVDENEKLTVTFNAPLKYTHYRFRIINNTKGVNDTLTISGAVLVHSPSYAEQMLFTGNSWPEFIETNQEDKTTQIKISGYTNTKINEITVATEDMFKRPVYFAGGRSKTLYNLTFGDNAYRDLTLYFDGYSSGAEFLEMKISNGDDKPIKITGIRVSYFTDEVIFKGEAGKTYTMTFGNREITSPPVYDIANYRDLILREGYDMLSYQIFLDDSAPPEPEETIDYGLILNIVIMAVSALLVVLIVIKLSRPHT